MRAVPALALSIGVLLASGPSSTAQPVYRWVDAQGNVRYSGFPPPAGVATEAPAALPGPAGPSGLEPIRERPPGADEMLQLCGLRARLPGLLREAVAHLVRSRVAGGGAGRDSSERAAARALDPARVYALLRDEYERRSAPERRPAVAAWLRSPAGRRIVGVQLESARHVETVGMAALADALERRPPTPARRELIERLDWVSGSAEVSADVALAVQQGLARGLAAAVPRQARLRPGQLAADAQAQRPRLVAAVRERVRLRLLHAFRDLADEDIRQYIEFEGSPDARAHNRALHRALVHALGITAERAGTALALPPHDVPAAAPTGRSR